MWFKFNTITWLILLPGYLSQDLEYLREALPGEPGVDYPIFSLPPPETSFDCSDKVRLDAECRKLLCKKYSFRLKYERTLNFNLSIKSSKACEEVGNFISLM